MIMSYEQIKELAFMIFKYIMIIRTTAFFMLLATKIPGIIREAKARKAAKKKDKNEEQAIEKIITKIESTDPKKDIPKMKRRIGFVSAISDDN